MSTVGHPPAPSSTNGVTAELNEWRGHTRVFLQPIAAPSILGLFGFAIATFMVTAYMVGWYGTATSPLMIFPFALAAGGIAQGLAAILSYKARDGVATALHGIWASFWLGYGFLQFMIALKLLPAPARGAANPVLAYWFFTIAAVTLAAAVAAMFENLGVAMVAFPLGAGSALLGVFFLVGSAWLQKAGGYVTMFSACTAFYVAFALMLSSTTGGRVLLPLGALRKESNIPGGHHTYPIQFAAGEPGVKKGQ